jgi:hypothetical protein
MATNAQLISPSEVEVEKLVPRIVAQANEIVIQSQDDYDMTASFLQYLSRGMKAVSEKFDPTIDAAHKSHKAAIALKKEFMDPLVEAERTTKRKMVSFDEERERQERERQRIAQEEARKKAEADAAEAARLAKEEADRKAAAALAEAAQLEAQGESHLAEIVLQAAAEEEKAAPVVVMPVAAPVVAPISAPKTSGIAKTEDWKWGIEGDDEASALLKLVRAAATDHRLLAYLAFNTKTIGSAVKTQKSLAVIPGISTWPEKNVKTTGR